MFNTGQKILKTIRIKENYKNKQITFKKPIKMKLKNRLKILLCNGYVVLLCTAIIVSLPLQFILFLLQGKNRILKNLEDKIYKTLFRINDLRKKTSPIHPLYK